MGFAPLSSFSLYFCKRVSIFYFSFLNMQFWCSVSYLDHDCYNVAFTLVVSLVSLLSSPRDGAGLAFSYIQIGVHMFEYVMRHQMDCCTSFLLAPTCSSRMNLQDYSITHIILFFHSCVISFMEPGSYTVARTLFPFCVNLF